MIHLQQILQLLEARGECFHGEYFIPEVWKPPGFENFQRIVGRNGQISVNPYEFWSFCIRNLIIDQTAPPMSAPEVQRGLGNAESFQIGKNVIYSMLPRMFTAWDHYRQGELCNGTFLKTIGLLPFLKGLNVTLLYLLPIFKYSDRYKKGGLGSPYAIKNIYRLDPGLHDELLGPDQTLVETEFKALVEACHLLGIKVMVDFVFRTVARDSDLLLEHPDWFYWVDQQHGQSLGPLPVETLPPLSLLNAQTFPQLYQSSGLSQYLAQFATAPNQLDPERWRQLAVQAQQTGANPLELVEERFHLTTAPGFSDVINDNQPLWTDVTYLRFYFDHHPAARPYLPVNQPPYILQDVACLNLYQGEVINQELWDYTANVIPYYQQQFQIDGARIDMGHALPPALNREIIARIKRQNPEFILWSEEFAVQNARQAKQDGFHFINGELWVAYKGLEKPFFKAQLLQMLEVAELPLIAALETPDTSRLALLGDRRKITLLVWLNFLLPNVVPLINNGMELGERQPMNLGFNDVVGGEYVLEAADPMYGRLAFFDFYQLHWLNPDREWLMELIKQALKLRRQFEDLITLANLVGDAGPGAGDLITLGYLDAVTNRNLWFVANRNFQRATPINLSQLLPEALRRRYTSFKTVWSPVGQGQPMEWELAADQRLDAGATFIGWLE